MNAADLVDLHCHLLFGIDDGPADSDGAVELARAMVAAGTRTAVATPHVNHGWPNDSTVIAERVGWIQDTLAYLGVDLEVVAGAEVALTRATELDDDELVALRLGGGPFLLVECPSTPSAIGFEQALGQLTARGHRIVLAHVERIPSFQRDFALVERLVGAGMLVQVTAASLAGLFGARAQQSCQRLLAAGLVHDIASDAHSATSRGPQIAEHAAALGLEDHLGYFARDVPRAILDGTPIAPSPRVAPPGRRGVLGRVLRRAS